MAMDIHYIIVDYSMQYEHLYLQCWCLVCRSRLAMVARMAGAGPGLEAGLQPSPRHTQWYTITWAGGH